MYLPSHFTETDRAEIAALIDARPLAALVVATNRGLVANHIPLLRDGDGLLVGHIAIANELHRLVPDGHEVLAIFGGDDSYISPNWYPGKAAHHKVVPTWNYRVVHVHGRISFQHDDKAKRAVVGRLTTRFERETNGDAAWKMADAPVDFMAEQLDAIVGISIAVDRVAAKSKLSQNGAPEDFASVTKELGDRDKPDLARRMRDLSDARDDSDQ